MKNAIPYDYKQFINEKVLEYFPGPFNKIGNKINARCFLCGDSKKNLQKKRFFYYLDTCSAYCFNCGASLSGMKLLELISGANFKSIKKEYFKMALKSEFNSGLSSICETPTDVGFNFSNVVPAKWKKPLSENARSYLNGRHVLDAPFLKEDLYSCFNDKTNEEFILIPWRVNGVDAYYQVNDFMKYSSLKYIFPKNKHKLVYGLDNINLKWDKIIVMEGVYDSLFVPNAVAVGTKSITEYQLELIRRRYPKMKICVSFDNDKPGLTSVINMIKDNKNFCYFKWFNQNTKQKDINDYVLAKNDVNIFANTDIVDKLIISPMKMKMYLMENGFWKSDVKKSYFKSELYAKL